jgi:hypothetical protein
MIHKSRFDVSGGQSVKFCPKNRIDTGFRSFFQQPTFWHDNGDLECSEEIPCLRRGAMTMRIHYRFFPLSRDEREMITVILCEELEIQRWCDLEFNCTLNREVVICLQ